MSFLIVYLDEHIPTLNSNIHQKEGSGEKRTTRFSTTQSGSDYVSKWLYLPTKPGRGQISHYIKSPGFPSRPNNLNVSRV